MKRGQFRTVVIVKNVIEVTRYLNCKVACVGQGVFMAGLVFVTERDL